jgi:hypothetical protein
MSMSTEPINPPEGSTWGAPAPAAQPSAKKAWSGRKTAVAVGVAVLIAAGGGVAIAVGTSGNSAAQAPQGFGGAGGRNFGGPPGAIGGLGGGAAALRNALHGDFVVSDGSGGYLTERMQTGDVTAVSATSIALTSTDGYQQVYTIDSSTRINAAPKTGDIVTVVAKVSGSTATATTITAGGQSLPGGGQGRRGGYYR